MPWVSPNGKGFRPSWRVDGKIVHGETVETREQVEQWIADRESRSISDLARILDQWKDDAPGNVHRKTAAERVLAVCRANKWTRVEQITLRSITDWRKRADAWAVTKKEGADLERVPSVERALQYLLTVLRWHNRHNKAPVDADVLALRPSDVTRGAARRPPRKLLSDDQVAAIRECSHEYGPRAAAVVDYLLTYGARPITACRLRLRDLDVEACTLTIPNAKHSGGWTHPIGPKQRDEWIAAADHADPEGPLFPHYQAEQAGKKLARPWRINAQGSADEIKNWWRGTIAKRLKLPKESGGIYDLKRWSITRMLAAGLDPATVAEFTGHLDQEIVLTYSVTNQERAKAALAKLLPDLGAGR